MSDLKPKGMKIKLGNNEYGMRFTLNAIDEIQDHFDIPVSQLGNLFSDERNQIKNIRYLLTILINEDIDCLNDDRDEKISHIEERYIGRHIDSTNMKSTIQSIYAAFTDSTPESGDSEDSDPNVMSE